jgi:hypothetical protein
MYGTIATHIRWLKMTNLKKCKSDSCKCVKKLTLLYVTNPKMKYEEEKLERSIKIYENVYKNCFDKQVK